VTQDVVSSTRRTYDQIAQAYDEQLRPPAPELHAFRDEFCRAALGRVADLGCGPGRDLQLLATAGLDVVGIDLSDGMLALARTRGRVARGDLRRPPLRQGSLGGIWSSAALLHVPRDEVLSTLSAWHSLLAPGGLLGLSTSLGSDEGWEVVPYAGPGPAGGPLHRWFVHHEAGALLELLRAAGFTVISSSQRKSHRDWLMVLAQA
jgi:SAM-dependent methyltransferase